MNNTITYNKDKNDIYVTNDKSNFIYNDGDDIEERIYDILKNSSDLNVASDELSSKITDWPTEYHFSPLRSNLLKSFRFNLEHKVLEIGSGCGTITRQLAENNLSIDALEGSYRRALITKERCREFDNVKVINDNFFNFQTNINYDLITLIGVLEYAPLFFPSEDSCKDMLKKVFNLLNKNGLLIIAIENRLGLKYFHGVADMYDNNSFLTLGREELLNVLNTSGFENVEFLYPFPDYKLTQLLIRKEALDNERISLGDIISSYPARDYSGFNVRFFEEKRTWPIFEKNKLLPDFSNSFLIFAWRENGNLSHYTTDWLIRTFSSQRKRKYLTFNNFYEKNKSVYVNKRRLYPETINSPLILLEEYEEEYILGKINNYCLFNQKNNKKQLVYINYIKEWLNYVLILLEMDISDINEKTMICGKYYDLILNNIIKTDNGLKHFDLEWKVKQDIPLYFLIFRCIYHDMFRNYIWYKKTKFLNNTNIISVINEIYKELNFSIKTETILETYIPLEVQIQSEINIKSEDNIDRLKQTKEGLYKIIKTEYSLDFLLKNTLGLENINLRKQNTQLTNTINDLNSHIHDISNGPSWKIGRAITYIPRKFTLLNDFIKHYKELGLIDTLKKIKFRIKNEYKNWYKKYYKLDKNDRYQIKQHVKKIDQPLISVIVPVYNTPENLLRLCLDSVINQLYENWELCIADDCSNLIHIKQILQEYQQTDERIKVIFRKNNGHISQCTNSALKLAKGDYIAFLDHDDELSEDALYHVALTINKNPDAELIYSDEDKIDLKGNLKNPFFKPNWSPDLIHVYNFVCHLSVYKKTTLDLIDGLNSEFDGAQDWDLVMRFVDKIDASCIYHIPRILYHWRLTDNSTALDINNKKYAIKAAKLAINEDILRKNNKANLNYSTQLQSFIETPIIEEEPLVSIIIPTRNSLELIRKITDDILNVTN